MNVKPDSLLSEELEDRVVGMAKENRSHAQKLDPSLRSLPREAIFVIEAGQYGSLYNPLIDRQPVCRGYLSLSLASS
jgi:hypothetical protein